jgi:hypothetical protein
MTSPRPKTNPASRPLAGPGRPPTKRQLALMIWLGVLPTLTMPIVSHGLMPPLSRLRRRLLARMASG